MKQELAWPFAVDRRAFVARRHTMSVPATCLCERMGWVALLGATEGPVRGGGWFEGCMSQPFPPRFRAKRTTATSTVFLLSLPMESVYRIPGTNPFGSTRGPDYLHGRSHHEYLNSYQYNTPIMHETKHSIRERVPNAEVPTRLCYGRAGCCACCCIASTVSNAVSACSPPERRGVSAG